MSMKDDFRAWQEISEHGDSPQAQEQIKLYLAMEKAAYDKILSEQPHVFAGPVAKLQEELGFAEVPVIFAGFLDGLNPCLKTKLDLETLTGEDEIRLDIDWETLYYKMHEAEASWLYDLESWDGVLSQEVRDKIRHDYRESKIVRRDKVGRNDPCPCGSGKKFKKCCGRGG